MGNRRGSCRACNRFAARARNALLGVFRTEHPALYQECLVTAEERTYRSTVGHMEEGQ